MNCQITVAICNFNTEQLTNDCISSVHEHLKAYPFKIVVLDNSDKTRFHTNHDVKVLDNTHGQLIDFNQAVKRFSCAPSSNNYASLKHALSIQFLIDSCPTDLMLLLDSDTKLLRDIDFIDSRYASVSGIMELKRGIPRTTPFIQLFNVKMLKKNGIRYFDPSRMHGGKFIGQCQMYDTGASFLEDIVKKHLPYRVIDNDTYIWHKRCGSWSQRTALVAVAKDEDHYIDEWIDYHLALGFTDIYIYQNNWRAKLKKDRPNVHLLEYDGMLLNQVDAYNSWIDKFWSSYDWAAFFDIDEFLLLKNGMTHVSQFVSKYSTKHAIKIMWRRFGDNGLAKVVDGNYSVIHRFMRSAKELGHKPKTMINLSVSHNIMHISGHECIPDPPIRVNDSDAELAHYMVKTKAEFIQRKYNARTLNCGQYELFKNLDNVIAFFNSHNKNERVNTSVLDLWNRIKGRLK